MAQFKASLPVFAPIKSETDSAITYENGAFVGKMVKTEVKPNKVEALSMPTTRWRSMKQNLKMPTSLLKRQLFRLRFL